MQAPDAESPGVKANRLSQVSRPSATGVLHLGLGAFSRAHQAYFFDRLIEQGHSRWGVAAVNLRSLDIVQTLRAQNNVYTRWERGRNAEVLRSIGALTGSYHLPTMRNTVLDLFRNPDIQMITITVSEKGYHFDSQRNGLYETDMDVIADLNSPSVPTTLPGLLTQGLDERRKTNAGPITIASCDNYRNNGNVLKSVVYDFARHCYRELPDWLDRYACFPSSMVDGIVPKVRNEDRLALELETGICDPALVVAEDYMRWVIEDDFAGERPPLELVGAEIVADVEPYETMKLLLLNAPHSAVAYLGSLAGFDYVHEAVANPVLRTTVEQLLRDELMPVAENSAGIVAAEYGGQTINRFANPNIAYRTQQVATDGSLKIQQRIFPALSWHLSKGTVPDGLSLVLAGWMRFLQGVTDSGERYEISDPMANPLTTGFVGEADGLQIVRRILAIKEIFPVELSQSQDLTERIAWHFDGIERNGILPWLQQFLTNKGRV